MWERTPEYSAHRNVFPVERPSIFIREALMTVLITGAGGFIASYLIAELIDEGAQIIGFDIAPKPEALERMGEKLTWIRGDLSSSADLYRVFLEHKPTHIVHLASILAGPCEENPVRGFSINFLSTATLLDAALRCQVERFIMTSSISVFGKDAPEPVQNDEKKNPATVYGQTKLASEHLMRWYKEKHGLSVCALRFPWVFGPGRERGITALYSSKLLDAVARGESLEIPNPDECGDWLYVKDASMALRSALKNSNHSSTTFNIMGSLHSIREVMEIAKAFRPNTRIQYSQEGKAASPYPTAYDDSLARKELGWKPNYSIQDAVREHIETVEKRKL